jgi:hypothetical protein
LCKRTHGSKLPSSVRISSRNFWHNV